MIRWIFVLMFAVILNLGASAPVPAQHDHAPHEGVIQQHGTTGVQWEGSPAGKAFSEFNHHLAGMFVILIGLSELRGVLALTSRALQALAWTRFLLPLAMLAAGTYLAGWSDHDAWPIGSQNFSETFYGRDQEILQHKTYALLLLTVGTIEIFRRMGKLRQPAWAVPLPLFAIVGGLMLFLHEHGEHPSAHRIAINHMVMGTMAIAAGSLKLVWLWKRGQAHFFAAHSPDAKRQDQQRGLSPWYLAWPVLILLIGLQLLLYTE